MLYGAEEPDIVTEESNRQIAGYTESLRGKGPHPNFLHYIRNTHPLLALCCKDAVHPFSFPERLSLVLVVSAFGYFMAALQHEQFASMSSALSPLPCSVLMVTLPSMALEFLAKYFATADYRCMLKKVKYFDPPKRVRVNKFCRRFIKERHLAEAQPVPTYPVPVWKKVWRSVASAFGKQVEAIPEPASIHFMYRSPAPTLPMESAICACLLASCHRFYDGIHVGAVRLFGDMFSLLALVGAACFSICAYRMHKDSDSATCISALCGMALNLFCFSFMAATLKFYVAWHWQHWTGRRWSLGHLGFLPPLTEVGTCERSPARLLPRHRVVVPATSLRKSHLKRQRLLSL